MGFLEALRRVSRLGFYLGAGAALTLVQACGAATSRDGGTDADQRSDAEVDADRAGDADPDGRPDADPDRQDADPEDDWDIPLE